MKTHAQVSTGTSPDTAHFMIGLDEQSTRELIAFQHLSPSALEKYKGQFVAISGGKIIDHDFDEMALAARVSRLPKFVLINKVS